MWTKENKKTAIINNTIGAIVVFLILYLLCKSGHTGWAWIVVLLPIIFPIIFIILFMFGFIVGEGLERGKRGEKSLNEREIKENSFPPRESYGDNYERDVPWGMDQLEWLKEHIRCTGVDEKCVNHIAYRLINTFDFPYIRQYYTYNMPDISCQINVKTAIQRAYFECGQDLGYIPDYED